MLYLEEPWSELAVEHDVKAEYLKADALGAGRLRWATHAVGVKHVRVSHDHRLHITHANRT